MVTQFISIEQRFSTNKLLSNQLLAKTQPYLTMVHKVIFFRNVMVHVLASASGVGDQSKCLKKPRELPKTRKVA